MIFQQEHIAFGIWMIFRMVNIWVFMWIIGEYWKNIEQLLFNTDY